MKLNLNVEEHMAQQVPIHSYSMHADIVTSNNIYVLKKDAIK